MISSIRVDSVTLCNFFLLPFGLFDNFRPDKSKKETLKTYIVELKIDLT